MNMMFVFLALPIRRVSLKDLCWNDGGINKDELSDPHIRREIDETPIWVEQLLNGKLFVHYGRHRSIRALARGEHEIYAHALTNSLRRASDEARQAQAPLANLGQTEGTDCTLF